jgi:hypothetical protein
MNNLYSIKIAKCIDDIEVLRPAWEKLQWHPDGDIDRYINMLNSRPEIVCPYVLTLYRDGIAVALLICRIEDVPWEFKFGYKKLLTLKARRLAMGYGGILGNLSDEGCEALIKELNTLLGRKEVSVVFFQNLRIDSNFYEICKARGSFLRLVISLKSTKHWSLLLPKSYNEYFSSLSKNVRKNIKNYWNRLRKKYDDNIRITCFKKCDEIDDLLNDTEAIVSQTYHRGLGAGFVYNKETRDRYNLALSRGMHRTYILYIGQNPVTFWSGTLYKSVFYLAATGFIPKYRDDQVGTLLLQKIIEEFCNDGKITKIDFGLGEAQYKHSYGNEVIEEASVYLFAPNIKGIIIYILSVILMTAENASREFLKKYDLEDKIKKLWRNKLAKQQTDSKLMTAETKLGKYE